MDRRIPAHIARWLTFPRSLMEVAAAFGITVAAGSLLLMLFDLPGVLLTTQIIAGVNP
jgi:hypothetical protein